MKRSRDDVSRILDAMSYVAAVHRGLTATNTSPPSGVLPRVVSAILADGSLSDYVRCWSEECVALEAPIAVALPPIDASYRRVCDLLRRAGSPEV